VVAELGDPRTSFVHPLCIHLLKLHDARRITMGWYNLVKGRIKNQRKSRLGREVCRTQSWPHTSSCHLADGESAREPRDGHDHVPGHQEAFGLGEPWPAAPPGP
jgi:hypothetical protein